MKTWSVELRSNLRNDDTFTGTFTGTFEEFAKYCSEKGYAIDGEEARIADIDTEDGYCYHIVYSCEVAL